LLGTSGEPVGEPRRAWLERLDDAEIAPDALAVKLASNAGELSGVGPQVTGFTALLADPPAAARRIQVSLAPGKLNPTRGTASATAPARVPPPASEPRFAVPKAAPAPPSQLPPKAVLPASPAPETRVTPRANDMRLAAPKALPSKVAPKAVVPAAPAPKAPV